MYQRPKPQSELLVLIDQRRNIETYGYEDAAERGQLPFCTRFLREKAFAPPAKIGAMNSIATKTKQPVPMPEQSFSIVSSPQTPPYNPKNCLKAGRYFREMHSLQPFFKTRSISPPNVDST